MICKLSKEINQNWWYGGMVLANMAQLVGALFHTPKGCRLVSWSGHIPTFWVPFPVRVHVRDN